MAITAVQVTGVATPNSTSTVKAYDSNVTAGNLLVVAVTRWSGSSDALVVGDVSKSAGTATVGAFSLDTSGAVFSTEGGGYMVSAVLSAIVTGTGSCTITVANAPSGTYWMMGIGEFAPGSETWDATRVEDADAGQAETGAPTTGNVTSAGAALFVGVTGTETGDVTTHTAAGPFTNNIFEQEGSADMTGNAAYGIVAGTTTDAGEWSAPTTFPYRAVVVVYRVAAGAENIAASVSDGITFSLVGDEGAIIQGVLADGVSLSDVSGNIAEMFLAVSDGFKGADSGSNILALQALVADGIRGADSDANLKIMPTILIDGIQVSDTALSLMELFAAVAEGVDFSDLPSPGTQTISVLAADGIVLSDTTLAMLSAFATASDGARLSDYSTLASLIASLVADGLTLSDTAAANLALLISMSDGITVSDTGAVTLNVFATATDGVRLADTVSTVMQLFASLSEGVRLGDVATGVNSSTPLPSGQIKIQFSGKSASITFTGHGPRATFTGKSPGIS